MTDHDDAAPSDENPYETPVPSAGNQNAGNQNAGNQNAGDPHESKNVALGDVPSVGEIFGHPRGLFFLFFAELWERFSFYGMRALLVLYLINDLFVGRTEDIGEDGVKEIAYEVYAAYGALVYFTPAIGGMIADRVIGHKNSIMLGAVLMTLGHFTMAFESELIFYLSLGLLIIGNGFFKPNISSLVGGLYEEGDVRRDGGFTIFYLGINLGALAAPLACGYLGQTYGWHYGFTAAGIGMFAGLLVFWYGRAIGVYGPQGEQPAEYANKTALGLNPRFWVYLGSFAFVPVFAFLVAKSEIQFSLLGGAGLLEAMLWGLLALVLVFLTWVCVQSDKVTRERLMVVVVLTFFITIFWAFFEQAGSSLTVFADEHVRLVGLNASQTNAINPGFIVLFAIPFSMMWSALERKNLNPGTMVKFGLGIGQLGLGFLVFALSARFMDEGGHVAMGFLILGYLLHTTGELFLSPIGLSKVTELSPAKLVSFMMGVWFLSSSFAHFIAGQIAKLTTGGGGEGAGEGEEAAAEVVAEPGFMANIATAITGGGEGVTASESSAALLNYCGVFAQIAVISFGFALLAIAISPLIKRMMHGIR